MAYRVLVVEDDPVVRSLICDLLDSAGYEVKSAADGVEALEIIVQGLPDLVLSDVLMPRMSGLELCALLKENARTRHLPVIFLTCIDDPVKGFDVGADDFVSKPFRTQELLARVQALLRRTSLITDFTPEGLRGKLTDLSLLNLLQALHMAGASGCLTVVRPRPSCRARLWLAAGRLLAAVLDGEKPAEGRQAVFELACWEEGLFSFDTGQAGQWEMALELDDHSETWGVDDSLEALLLEAVRLKDERDRLLPSSPGEQPAPATLARAGLYDEAQVSMGELARRIDEFRNRLKVKAFQAMIEGRSSVTSGLVHSAESRPDIDLPPELDQLIERMLSPDE